MRGLRTWLVPADARADRELDRAFAELTGGAEGKPETLRVMGRSFVVPLAARGVARCDFDLLCGTALGAGDYLALAARFHTLILDGIPRLSPDNYDQRAPLHRAGRYAVRSSRQAARIGRCDAGPAVSARRERANVRTHRLPADEMQSQDYLTLPHLT